MRKTTVFSFLLVLAASSAFAQTIRYRVSFPEPQTHFVEVEARVPAAGKSDIELVMPVWTPGSYLVREYSRHVENLQARTAAGRSLDVRKTRKNRWRIFTRNAPEVIVTYRVYGREMTVQSNWIGPEFALIQGAATFMTRTDALTWPHEVTIVLPPQWKQSISGMRSIAPNSFRAADYDTLVDSPVVAGNPSVDTFTVAGKQHLLVNVGDEQLWDRARAVENVQKIVEEQIRFWRVVPYDRYVFFNLIVNAGGGLEHKNSTVVMTRPNAMRTRKSYRGWLGLISHEFFHTWNVKQLRPAALGAFNYEEEVYTTDLWISEGFTSYYGDLLLRRANLWTQKEYLDDLSSTIEALQTTPGRLSQPVDLSSLDTWIRQYRPDANSPNVAISYYTKGQVIGFLLDARIRAATADRQSLDDVMRLAYQRYSGARGFTSEDFEAAVAEIGGKTNAEWLRRITATTEEMDYSDVMRWFGLRFKAAEEKKEETAEEEDDDPKTWLGIETRNDSGRLIVTQVRRQTSIYTSGLSVDDEIIAIDGLRVTPDQWKDRLKDYQPGDKVTLTVARRLRLIPVEVTLEKEPAKKWRLEPDPAATPEQKQHLSSWLGS